MSASCSKKLARYVNFAYRVACRVQVASHVVLTGCCCTYLSCGCVVLLCRVAVACCSVIDQEEWEGKIIAAGPAVSQFDTAPKEFPIIGGSGLSHNSILLAQP